MPASTSKSIPAATRQRLLDAAARVFARKGLEGATTREIAREARVNEVTLFRHFKTKDNLLAQVVQRTFDRQEETLAAQCPPARPTSKSAAPDLRASLRRYAQRYHDLLKHNLPLLRTLIGEIHRHREHELRVFKGVFTPLKAELQATIKSAQADRQVRPGIVPLVAADVFGSMIFTEVFRRASPYRPKYLSSRYLKACVDIFARGIEN